MDTTELKDLCKYFKTSKDEVERLKQEMDMAKEEMNKKKLELMSALDIAGLQSIKTSDYYFSKCERKDMKITEELLVWDYLNNKTNKEIRNDVVSEHIDKIKLKSIAKRMLKETGEVIEGMEPVITMTITVKKS